MFRLVMVHGSRHPVCLITSVRNPKLLSARAVCEVYRQRWDVELFYRRLKQTFGRWKLPSTSPLNATVELEWSLVVPWGLGLRAAVELGEGQGPAASDHRGGGAAVVPSSDAGLSASGGSRGRRFVGCCAAR